MQCTCYETVPCRIVLESTSLPLLELPSITAGELLFLVDFVMLSVSDVGISVDIDHYPVFCSSICFERSQTLSSHALLHLSLVSI